MDERSPNLLCSLLDLFPSDTPENFLSEVFANVLRESHNVCDLWTSKILKQDVSWAEYKVTTRCSVQSERGSTVYPDMQIEGRLLDDTPAVIFFEHKWKAGFCSRQIDDYSKEIEKKKLKGIKAHLAFVGSNRKQCRDAEESKLLEKDKIYLWEQVYTLLEAIPTPDQNLIQFLDFMKQNGLNPGEPIDKSIMVAFVKSSDFVETLKHTANKLLNGAPDWSFIPSRYRKDSPAVKDRFGRVAIEFVTPGWNPTITAGFLYDEDDHKVKFVNREKGIDLFLRIEAQPSALKNASPALLAELERKRKNFTKPDASVLLRGERGNGNKHTLLIVRSCLGDVINNATTQQAQEDAIYQTLKDWGETLFADGQLEKALQQLKLDGGM